MNAAFRRGVEKHIVVLLGVAFGALLTEGLLLIAFQALLANIMSGVVNALLILLTTMTCFVAFPYVTLKKVYKVDLHELGLSGADKKTAALSLAIAVLGVAAGIIYKNTRVSLGVILLQNAAVAAAEEFIARGCVFFILRKIKQSFWFVVPVSTLIFVFIFHSNAPLVENLIWRLPISAVLALAYYFTKRLYVPVSIHFAYNVAVSMIIG